MLVIFAVIIGGIITGAPGCRCWRLVFVSRMITVIIWLLLFLLGLEVGSDPTVVGGMGRPSDARPLSSSHARSRAASVCRGCCGAASGAGTLCPTEAVRNRRDCLPRLRISREGRQAARPQLAGTPDPFPYGTPCGGAS